MSKNQNGFSVVEILIVISVVGLIGALGWFVYNRNQNKTNVDTSPAPTLAKTTVNSTQQEGKQANTYSDSIAHYNFDYPKDWILDVKKESGYTKDQKLEYFNSVTIKSPDYSDNGVDGAGNEVKEGGAFRVTVGTNQSDDSEICEQSGDNCVTVSGQKADQQTHSPGPDGGYFITTYFIKGELEYSISYLYPESEAGHYTSEYNALLASFNTNN